MTLIGLAFQIISSLLLISRPRLIDACGYPGSPSHSSVIFSGEVIEPGILATYKCDPGFELLGPSRRLCAENGTWIPLTTPLCVFNVAIGKASLQSSVMGKGNPQKALDGTTSSFFNPDTCTSTEIERSPWWYVNLLEPYLVQLVRIDFGTSCCPNNNPATITVRVGNNRPDISPNPVCKRYVGFLEEGRPLFLLCNSKMPGAFVSIHLEGPPRHNPLSICEVFVYTDQVLPIERCPSFREQPPGSGATYNGKCYIFYSNQPKTFENARSFCENRGGTLVDESNPALQGFLSWELYRRHRNDPSGQYWMGAIRNPNDPHTWKWINGQDVTISYWSPPRANENCSRFDGGKQWLWSETNCNLNLNYICVHKPLSCGKPAISANSSLQVGNFDIGSTIEYQCSAGHILVGPMVRTCLPTGFYTEFPPKCRYLECGYPAFIQNGNYTLLNGTTHYLSMVHYYCNKGFQLVGRGNLVCDVDEKWNGPPPMCDPIICRPPPSILRGHLNLTSQSTAYGSQVVYECDVGYKLVGDSILICGDSGDWEGKIPTCYAHPKGMDGKRSQTKRPSLFSSRLNMGGIIALGVFGGFVFLAVAITIIVIIVRRTGNKRRRFGGSTDNTTITTYDSGDPTNEFAGHSPYRRSWEGTRHPEPNHSRHYHPHNHHHHKSETGERSNFSPPYRQDPPCENRNVPRDRRYPPERYREQPREDELTEEVPITRHEGHRRSDRPRRSDGVKCNGRHGRDEWPERKASGRRCKHEY
ncbi:uncharacterized protein LOC111638392 isoform X1 [Centruroides sculpturatus]|uniref:uncharacterized protein LOC111638392 isoform X1 n=1 Tax=Centruroides sculpturatus TaxID=218467 RepID=UPI000C6D51E1|nr:uncharacterized protein LOC111638392 isoform X1 [Centruroides sculpturatus]